MSVMRETMPCPCGHRDATYAACCGRLHAGMRADGPYAQQAEELMRSRYSAFAVQDASYLLATWAPDQRPATLDFDVGVKWLGLTIRDGVVHDACHAEVEFVARYKPPVGPAVRLHERSRFIRQDGRWLYVDGQQF
jgi:SEC-C motif-containing protein